ncbi:MAG: 2-C-methyl-D-erythritol 2,4-cyclodiphosphate synthase [Rikenellaceae bacterium]
MKKIRIGYGYDVHRLSEGESLWLGGIKIEHTKGTVAHSDGDVLIHAICDSLLGALALGDIGKHFPDTSSNFKDIDSKILLSRCVDLIESKGYKIGNLDTMLILEKPKIMKYIDVMRNTLAPLMHISIDDISIKATTKEGLSFVGREEGVEAHSTVLVYKD